MAKKYQQLNSNWKVYTYLLSIACATKHLLIIYLFSPPSDCYLLQSVKLVNLPRPKWHLWTVCSTVLKHIPLFPTQLPIFFLQIRWSVSFIFLLGDNVEQTHDALSVQCPSNRRRRRLCRCRHLEDGQVFPMDLHLRARRESVCFSAFTFVPGRKSASRF